MYDLPDEKEFHKLVQELFDKQEEENDWVIYPDIPISIEEVRRYIKEKYGEEAQNKE